MTYCIKAGSQWLRLTYDGARMAAELIPARTLGPFCYAAEWATRAAAERNRARYQPQFTEALEVTKL